jgi:hypothetical protein
MSSLAEDAMALTKFVRNVDDLSDSGGRKFRFKCDSCGHGFETRYVTASANQLKTVLDVFNLFRWLDLNGGWGRRMASGIDPASTDKERDAAYERAAREAQAHFRNCSACDAWVCRQYCWNEAASLCARCEDCASNSRSAMDKRAAQNVDATTAVAIGARAQTDDAASCPACGAPAGGARFCQACGLALQPQRCEHCASVLSSDARFCGGCGRPQP